MKDNEIKRKRKKRDEKSSEKKIRLKLGIGDRTNSLSDIRGLHYSPTAAKDESTCEAL